VNAVQLGSGLRRIRVRLGLRQADVAARARTSQVTVSRVERGQVGRIRLELVARIAAAVEADVGFDLRWRGGELPRVLNAGHAAMHEALARRFVRLHGWLIAPEVSFAIYGERGVVDALAFHPASRSLLVIELKTQLVDVQGLIGTVDRYRRLAPTIARARGWQADSVGVCVLLRESVTNRRHVQQHGAVLAAAFPDDGRRLRGWLKRPEGRLAALTFLSYSPGRNASARVAGVQRVRLAKTSVARPVTAP
jgi:transcriptional regulator with XRE-family HTH domain